MIQTKPKARYIENEIIINIRFSEVDAMHIVWHGNYLKFFEDGREALGSDNKLDYIQIAENGVLIPIVRSEIDHLSTIGYGDKVKVTTRLVDSPAAKIIHEYEVMNMTTNKVAAKGKTIQVFVDKQQNLIISIPDFYAKWKSETNWIEIDE